MLELLNQLDGFEGKSNIKVVMATNRIDILDDALLRPGRIDRKVEFPHPNEEARMDILKIHSRKMNLMRGIDMRKIARQMNGRGSYGLYRGSWCLGGSEDVGRSMLLTLWGRDVVLIRVLNWSRDPNLRLASMVVVQFSKLFSWTKEQSDKTNPG